MNKKILLVDDDKNFAAGLQRSLRARGIEAAVAHSALEAVEMIQGGAFDILISDQKMPDCNGTELLHLVAEMYPNTVSMMLTGYPRYDVALDAINFGQVFKFLTKPVDISRLITAIVAASAESDNRIAGKVALDLAEMQSSYINNLEQEHPGIGKVRRSQSGAIIIDEGD
jgi:DNA-binding NtrC family response regulator